MASDLGRPLAPNAIACDLGRSCLNPETRLPNTGTMAGDLGRSLVGVYSTAAGDLGRP
jgi:hypothetical protein